MEEFGDGIESLYQEVGPTETRHEKTSVQQQNVSHETKGTSFFDLPAELRDAIYDLALPQGKKIRIGVAYDCELPPGVTWNRNRMHQGNQYLQIVRSEVSTVYWTKVIEQLPPLVSARLDLRAEMLGMYYARNTFVINLRTFLDRQLCLQWINKRGDFLRGLQAVHLHLPIDFIHWVPPFTITLTAQSDTWAALTCTMHQTRHVSICRCTFEVWVDRTLKAKGRHPDYGILRERDHEPVVMRLAEVLEVLEWAEEIYTVNGYGRTERRWGHRWDRPKTKCHVCGLDVIYLE